MKTNVHQKPLTPDVSLLKQINFTRILSLLRYYPRLTRAHMAPQTGLTRSTVTVITIELIATGLVRKGRETTSGPDGGRPGVELELNRDGAFLLEPPLAMAAPIGGAVLVYQSLFQMPDLLLL